MKEIQCQICWALVLDSEERCIVHTHDADYNACMLCGAASEKLGWWISV